MSPEAPPSLFQRLRAAPISAILFACCLGVFALAESQGSTTSTETLLRYGATWRGSVWHGEWWRLFTSMFLHIGIVHLAWNLYAGFSWTAPFERELGAARFLLIYLLSGLAGSAASVIGHDAVSAGASGALFGVIGGVLVVQRQSLGSWSALWAVPHQRRNLTMVAIWLAIGPWAGFDSFAHAGGLLAGAALTWAMQPLSGPRLGAAALAIAVLVLASLRPIPGLHDDWVIEERASAAYQRSDWAEVLVATEHVTSGTPRLLWLRASALTNVGRAAEAAPLLEHITIPEVVGLRARVRYAQGEYGLALQDAEQGLLTAPQSVELLELQVLSLLALDRPAEADAVAAKWVQLTPRLPDALAARAQTLIATHHPAQALESLSEARRLAPGSFDAEQVRALLALGRVDDAREALAAAKLDPAVRTQLEVLLAETETELPAP